MTAKPEDPKLPRTITAEDEIALSCPQCKSPIKHSSGYVCMSLSISYDDEMVSDRINSQALSPEKDVSDLARSFLSLCYHDPHGSGEEDSIALGHQRYFELIIGNEFGTEANFCNIACVREWFGEHFDHVERVLAKTSPHRQ